MKSVFSTLFSLLFFALFLTSCNKTGDEKAGSGVSTDLFLNGITSGGGSSGGSNIGGDTTSVPAGVLTAGEWNDFDNWPFWKNLLANDTFSKYQLTWGFNCSEKWTFSIKDNHQAPVADAKITIAGNGLTLWQGKTNKFGVLNVLPAIFSASLPPNLNYTVSYNNQDYSSGPLSTGTRTISILLPITATSPINVDVMFVVDATGSMGDEINYLKNELLDVLNRADNQLPGILRYAGVFYRDIGDDYITRASNFSGTKTDLINFVKAQNAGGGGDWPEAVEEALKTAMQQNWSSSAKARLLFLILDAPPHEDAQKLQLMRQQIQLAASKGIMIIPISASGIDKATEFLFRFMAQATNSTYTFLTNHSGIGNNHITPTVGSYQVEYLNNLIVRLITKYGGN